MSVAPIPPGFHTVTPYFLAEDADRLLGFLEKGLGGEVTERVAGPDDVVLHAQVRLGDSMVMLGQGGGDFPPRPCFLYLYVEDARALYERAVAAGASSIQAPRDEFYGDRTAAVRDVEGNVFWIATHIEDVPPEEVERRAAAARETRDH